ncbi:MAG: hypothetical protein WAM89_19555 [Terriglobales bacterium]
MVSTRGYSSGKFREESVGKSTITITGTYGSLSKKATVKLSVVE